MTLAALLSSPNPTTVAIGTHLDQLDPDVRRNECLALSSSQQKQLWRVASAAPGEPQGLLSGEGQAVFAGRNTLQMFTRFEKRFAHVGETVAGYNHHRLSPFIGPGYFTVAPTPNGLLFDYAHLPASAPPGWPTIKPNTGGLARAVYGGLIDDVIWVSRDVLIGSARRGEVTLDSYFILVRG
jgi:hypothetical protein